jgi:hypothetical protein
LRNLMLQLSAFPRDPDLAAGRLMFKDARGLTGRDAQRIAHYRAAEVRHLLGMAGPTRMLLRFQVRNECHAAKVGGEEASKL